METHADVVITDRMDWSLSLAVDEDFPSSETMLVEEEDYYYVEDIDDEADEGVD